MITHYCRSLEEALKKAKQVAKQPGYDYWGKTFPDGKRGFVIYKKGIMVERYVALVCSKTASYSTVLETEPQTSANSKHKRILGTISL